MKPLLNRIRNDFNVSAAEVEHHDVWQSAGLAFIALATSRDTLERLERELEAALESGGDFAITHWDREWL